MLFALRVNGNNTARSIANEINHRVCHLQRTSVFIGFTKNGNGEPFAQLLLAIWLVKKSER